MTKTKQQLRAEAVERLRELNAYADGPESIVEKLAYGLSTDRLNYHVEIEHIIDLLTDDCGPCYSCAKLAELRAENNALRGMAAEKDDTITVLKAENAELQAKVDELHANNANLHELAGTQADEIDELTAQLEAAYAKNRSLRQHIAKMQAGRHGWHVKGAELQREVDRLTRENVSLARDLGECMAERDGLKRENAKLSDDEFYLRCTLVDMNGEVVS